MNKNRLQMEYDHSIDEKERVKCITFNKEAQDNLPEEVENRMRSDRLKANGHIVMTVDEILEDKSKCPLPLEVIPNNMGINLVSVHSISWKQEENQLKELTIHFIPNPN